MIRLYLRYRVTGPMGSVECTLHPNIIEDCKGDPRALAEEVKHEAWRELWNSPAKAMLKKLCDEYGVDQVKRRFSKSISIEEI